MFAGSEPPVGMTASDLRTRFYTREKIARSKPRLEFSDAPSASHSVLGLRRLQSAQPRTSRQGKRGSNSVESFRATRKARPITRALQPQGKPRGIRPSEIEGVFGLVPASNLTNLIGGHYIVNAHNHEDLGLIASGRKHP